MMKATQRKATQRKTDVVAAVAPGRDDVHIEQLVGPTWQDLSGSKYIVSHTDAGEIRVEITRPCGRVVRKTGTVHSSPSGRVLWGKGPYPYVLEKVNDSEFVWKKPMQNRIVKEYRWLRVPSLSISPAAARVLWVRANIPGDSSVCDTPEWIECDYQSDSTVGSPGTPDGQRPPHSRSR